MIRAILKKNLQLKRVALTFGPGPNTVLKKAYADTPGPQPQPPSAYTPGYEIAMERYEMMMERYKMMMERYKMMLERDASVTADSAERYEKMMERYKILLERDASENAVDSAGPNTLLKKAYADTPGPQPQPPSAYIPRPQPQPRPSYPPGPQPPLSYPPEVLVRIIWSQAFPDIPIRSAVILSCTTILICVVILILKARSVKLHWEREARITELSKRRALKRNGSENAADSAGIDCGSRQPMTASYA